MLTRRNILKCAGTTLALPYLESFAVEKSSEQVKNLVAIQMPFGFLSSNLYPNNVSDPFSSLYMSELKDLKGQVTLFNGFHNPGINGGHTANSYFLTCGSTAKKVNSISLDQEIADLRYKGETRFRCLVTGSGLRSGASYNRSGIKIPTQFNPADVFTKMFLRGGAKDLSRRRHELSQGKSILDTYSYYTKRLKGRFSGADHHKLDQYFSAIRQVEQELHISEAWLDKPMPKIDSDMPNNSKDELLNFKAFAGIFKLALENDSTSLITYDFGQTRKVLALDGIDAGYHTISHHRKQENKLKQLAIIELQMFKIFADFLKSLEEADLLDSTICIFGSGLEDPNNHSAARPPILVAGGGLKHKNYIDFQKDRVPLANLYLSIMEKMGVHKDSFGSSTGKFAI